MSHSIRAFTLGTATWDVVFDIPDFHDLFNVETGVFDGKVASAHHYEQAGGSAINTRLGLQAIARAFGKNATVFTCTKLGASGPRNKAKDYVLEEIGVRAFGDPTVMDAAFGQEFRVPKNTIILNQHLNGALHSGRAVLKAQPDVNTMPCPHIRDQIASAIAMSDIAILHSRDPDLALFAAERAREARIPVLFDCSEKSPEIVAKLGPVLKNADFVLAPGDAMVPGMKKKDAHELFGRLVEMGCDNFAISDNSHPILVYSRGEASILEVRKAQEVDVLCAGDTRDAVTAYFLAGGQDFRTALEKGSDIASLSVEHYGRDWIDHLQAHINASPLYENDRPATPGVEYAIA